MDNQKLKFVMLIVLAVVLVGGLVFFWTNLFSHSCQPVDAKPEASINSAMILSQDKTTLIQTSAYLAFPKPDSKDPADQYVALCPQNAEHAILDPSNQWVQLNTDCSSIKMVLTYDNKAGLTKTSLEIEPASSVQDLEPCHVLSDQLTDWAHSADEYYTCDAWKVYQCTKTVKDAKTGAATEQKVGQLVLGKFALQLNSDPKQMDDKVAFYKKPKACK